MEKYRILRFTDAFAGLIVSIIPAVIIVYIFSNIQTDILRSNIIKVPILFFIFSFVYLAAQMGYKSLSRFSFSIDRRFYWRNLEYTMFGAFESYYVMRWKINRIVISLFLLFPIGVYLWFGNLIGFTFLDAVRWVFFIYTTKCVVAGYAMTMETLISRLLFPKLFGQYPPDSSYERWYGFPCYGIFGFIYRPPKVYKNLH